MKITLTEDEIFIATYIAKRRRENNRSIGTTDRLYVKEDRNDPEKALQRDVDGMCAEMAVAKALNLYPDFTISNTHSGSYDLITHRKYTADVKQTDLPNGNLLVPIWKKKQYADVYILVIGCGSDYELIGWCWQKDVIKVENIRDMGHGDTYFLHKNKLRRFT